MILEIIKKRRLLFGFVFILPCTLSAQGLSDNDEVKFGIVHVEHLYMKKVRIESLNGSDSGVIDNIPTYWVRVNKDRLFHTLDKPKTVPAVPDLQPWDSLYYATQDYLTFYFDEYVYKRADTTCLSDVHEHSYDCVGRIEGTFINGVKEGRWEKVANGYIEGKFIYGKVIEESYKDGVLNGVRTVYSLGGKRLGRTIFVNGTGSYYDYYYDVGKIAVSGFLVYGKRHGYWTYYNQNGRIIRKEFYKHGLLHGPFTIYDNAGNILYETHFENGTGVYRRYKNDILVESGNMINGCRIGVWEELHVIRNSSSPNYEPGINVRKVRVRYTEKNPVNDSGSIVDVTFYDGDYIYIRAMRDE